MAAVATASMPDMPGGYSNASSVKAELDPSVPSTKVVAKKLSASSSGTATSSGSGPKSSGKNKAAESKQKESSGSGPKSSGSAETAEKSKEDLEREQKQKEVLKLIHESYLEAMKGKENKGNKASSSKAASTKGVAVAAAAAGGDSAESKKKGGGGGWFFGSSKKKKEEEEESGEGDNGKASRNGSSNLPEDLDGMIRFNAQMVGANMAYVNVVLRDFGTMVTDVVQYGTFQEQTDFLALALRKEAPGEVKIAQFKASFLSSMAAMIPAMWNSKYEQAWCWFWDSVDTLLQESFLHAAAHEQRVLRYVGNLDEDYYEALGFIIWTRFFAMEKEAELQLKQSFAIFTRISTQAIKYTALIFEDPTRMKDVITQVALKHIMWQIDPRYFAVFVGLVEEEVKEMSKDGSVSAAVAWALSVVASLMARIVTQGSNPVLVAAVTNDVKALKKAMGAVPKGTRAQAVLYS